MRRQKALHWKVDATPPEPVITFFREVEGRGNVCTKPFNKRALLHEINIKRSRGDADLMSWQTALRDLSYAH